MTVCHALLEQARDLHAEILDARRDHLRSEHRLATLLRRLMEEGLHQVLGYATIADYGRFVLDLEPRRTQELLRLGRGLADLPALDAALAAGEIPWTKAREVARVATPQTEHAWIVRAGALTSRQLEAEVAGAIRGEPPPDGPPEPERGPARRRVVFEMEASEAFLLKKALAWFRHSAGLSRDDFDDGVVLAAMAREVLARAEDSAKEAPTGEAYRIILSQCPSCGGTTSVDSEVSETVADEAVCDAEVVDARPGPDAGRATHTIPARARLLALAGSDWRCAVPGCQCRLWLDVHHLRARAAGGGHDPENLVALCSLHHRLLHEGLLALERRADGRIVVTLPDGREVVGWHTHVGHREARVHGEVDVGVDPAR